MSEFNEGDVFMDTKSKKPRTLRIESFGTDKGVVGPYMRCLETGGYVSLDFKALRSDRYQRLDVPPTIDTSEGVEPIELHVATDGMIHVLGDNCEGYCKPWGIGFPYRRKESA